MCTSTCGVDALVGRPDRARTSRAAHGTGVQLVTAALLVARKGHRHLTSIRCSSC